MSKNKECTCGHETYHEDYCALTSLSPAQEWEEELNKINSLVNTATWAFSTTKKELIAFIRSLLLKEREKASYAVEDAFEAGKHQTLADIRRVVEGKRQNLSEIVAFGGLELAKKELQKHEQSWNMALDDVLSALDTLEKKNV
jgi:hypothetical protein